MQPETVAEARAWFQKAANDLRGADIDLTAIPPLVEDALFHCQQAAEKAMKGFLTAHDTIFRKTHDLDELGQACEHIDSSLNSTLAAARDLTVFAWEFRYPGDSQAPSEEKRFRCWPWHGPSTTCCSTAFHRMSAHNALPASAVQPDTTKR